MQKKGLRLEFASKDLEMLKSTTKGVRMFGKNIGISLDILDKAQRALRVDTQDMKTELKNLEAALGNLEDSARELGVKPNSIAGWSDGFKVLNAGQKILQEAKKAQ